MMTIKVRIKTDTICKKVISFEMFHVERSSTYANNNNKNNNSFCCFFLQQKLYYLASTELRITVSMYHIERDV